MRHYIERYWVRLLLFLIAFLPRVIFPTHISVIPDVERDYGQAVAMIRGEGVSWLGIPSSVPRFSQGPLNIWFDALAFILGGTNVFAPVFFSGLLVSLGVVLFYSWLRRNVSNIAAFTATALWATSLAGIRQARMPFYLFAEPIFLLLFLWALERIGNSWKLVAIATFTFFLLFQWELATIPLFALLPLVFWRQRIGIKRIMVGMGSGALLGLLPQIIFDLTHQCRQLCGFGLWLIYRLTAVTGFDGRHGYTLAKLAALLRAIVLQLSDLVAWGSPGILLLIVGIGVISYTRKRKLKLLIVTGVGTGLLFFGLFIHGVPSEAYFPPFLILLPLLFAFGLDRLKPKLKVLLCAAILILSGFSVYRIVANRFNVPALMIYETNLTN